MDFLETQNILIIQLIFNFGKMEKNIVLPENYIPYSIGREGQFVFLSSKTLPSLW